MTQDVVDDFKSRGFASRSIGGFSYTDFWSMALAAQMGVGVEIDYE